MQTRMKLLVNIDQRATIAAGFSAPHSTELLEFEPSNITDAALRKFVAEHLDFSTGKVGVQFRLESSTVPTGTGWGSTCKHEAPAITGPATLEAALAALETLRQAWLLSQAQAAAAEAQEQAEVVEKCAAAIAAGPREVSIAGPTPRYTQWMELQYNFPFQRTDRIKAACAPILAQARDLTAENRVRRETAIAAVNADWDAREIQNKAAEARKTSALEAKLASAGTALQQERYRRGKLDLEAEILPLLADEAFLPLADWPRYARITDAEVRAELPADDYGSDPEVKYAVETAETLTDATMAAVLKIEKLLPGAEVECRQHNGYVDKGEVADIYRTSLKVTVKTALFTFSREFALPDAADLAAD